MGLAPRWISSPLPCQLRLALRAARLSHTAALVTVVVLASVTTAQGGPITRWLAVEDSAERCAAVVVLNGDHPARAHEAARLYQAGVAGEVWLTSDPASSDDAGDAGTRSNLAALVARGVPATAVRLLAGAARGTRAELEAVVTTLRQRALPCAVAVTSPLHARRVRLTWQRSVGSSPRLVVRHARDAGYTGWSVTAKELGATFLAWIGLPP
jgi:uncharacterized SAM-binding protein YcdF (DUF218 family)